MGVKDIVDQVNHIFSKSDNFDISGFAVDEVVTDDLVYALSHLSEKDRKNLKKCGYEFKWFDVDMTDGLIFRWVIEKPKKVFFTRRIYFNGKDVKR